MYLFNFVEFYRMTYREYVPTEVSSISNYNICTFIKEILLQQSIWSYVPPFFFIIILFRVQLPDAAAVGWGGDYKSSRRWNTGSMPEGDGDLELVVSYTCCGCLQRASRRIDTSGLILLAYCNYVIYETKFPKLSVYRMLVDNFRIVN